MKINFRKLGHVYKPSGDFSWGKTHAQVPFPFLLSNGNIRIFFSTRDSSSRSSVSFVDVDKDDPQKVLYVNDQPCLSMGAPGTFDDSGTMPSWFMRHNDEVILYYTGWNRSETAAYRLAIGCAVSKDEGKTFTRKFEGPVLDRAPFDPVWVGQPCVLFENGKWKMWYLSCEKIELIEGRPEPFYNVKYGHSDDGINWTRENNICIPFDEDTDAVGRPFVWKHEGSYFMMHSNRRADGYRTKEAAGYRVEISTSQDGISWKKLDHSGLKKSDSGWDSIMNEYASVFPTSTPGKFWVFYNGNGFGETGFGLAELTIEK